MTSTIENPLILTIDDEEAIRKLVRRLLERKGYRVVEGSDGREGLKVFREKHPDLVLTDLGMPGMGGLDVLSELKQISPDTPAIIVSGTGNMNDAIQAVRLGAWDYLEKPISEPEILYHTLEKNLEQSRLIKQNKEFQLKLKNQLEQIREDEEAGKKVQSNLMPNARWSSGPYTFTQEILPSLYLSGDFVDFFEISPTHVGFYIADVSGHGVSSALITVLLKSFMAKHLDACHLKQETTMLDPATLLAQLNDELLREDLEKHLTLFYAVLNPEENSIIYCNAGQFPFPLLDLGDRVERLEKTNLPIGLFRFAEYQNTQQSLPESFRLNIFSDGILEVLEQADLEEKLSYLETHRSEREVRELLQTVKEIEDLPDDITILTIEKH